MGFVNSIFNLFRFNKRNWKAILLCIFAATVFWFFNALNKNYAANIGFQIVFDYDQEKFVPVRSLPEKVRLNVSGNGWDLFRRSSGLKVPPLVIPLERPADVKKIVGASLPPLFSTQLEGLQVNFVITDTLYLDINQRTKRLVKIRIDSVEKYIQRNYGLTTPVTIVPDSIQVEGPESLINALPEVVSVSLPEDKIRSDYDDVIEVVMESEYINRTPPVVRVAFGVESLTEISGTCQLILVNVPDRLRPSAEVNQISFTYSIPVSKAKTIGTDSIRAVVDLLSIPRGNHKIVPLLTGLPDYSHVVKVDSVRISY